MRNPWRVRVKALPLEYWMLREYSRDQCLPHYKECKPEIGIPGIYMVRNPGKKEAWFELEDGRAFEYRVEDFQYTLALLNAGEFNARQVEALQGIVAQGLATKKQKHLAYLTNELKLMRLARVYHLRSHRRFKSFKERVGK
jgi:hypothetical protein